jgi:hypothetical protein
MVPDSIGRPSIVSTIRAFHRHQVMAGETFINKGLTNDSKASLSHMLSAYQPRWTDFAE